MTRLLEVGFDGNGLSEHVLTGTPQLVRAFARDLQRAGHRAVVPNTVAGELWSGDHGARRILRLADMLERLPDRAVIAPPALQVARREIPLSIDRTPEGEPSPAYYIALARRNIHRAHAADAAWVHATLGAEVHYEIDRQIARDYASEFARAHPDIYNAGPDPIIDGFSTWFMENHGFSAKHCERVRRDAQRYRAGRLVSILTDLHLVAVLYRTRKPARFSWCRLSKTFPPDVGSFSEAFPPGA